jgi:DNA polymerase (family 10)
MLQANQNPKTAMAKAKASGPDSNGAGTSKPFAPRRTNAEIAARFEEIAKLLETKNSNPFRVRAYRNAARTLQRFGLEVCDLLAANKTLTDIPDIGEDLAHHAAEFVASGRIALLDQLRREVPSFVVELMDLPGVGPKSAMRLWHELAIHSADDLHRAALDHRLRGLGSFGLKLERSIRTALETLPGHGRMDWERAKPIAEALTRYMAQAPGLERIETAGSFRRGMAKIGDLDLLACSASPSGIVEHFVRFGDVAHVFAAGPARASVVLACGLQVDLRVVPAASFGSALQYFTGSKAHNIALRRLAHQNGLKLSEYGVFRDKTRIAGSSEASVYAALNLVWITPELRENRGEIEAAGDDLLPTLVETRDILGDLHLHAGFDESEKILALARAAKQRHYAYIGIIAPAETLIEACHSDPESCASLLKRLPDAIEGVAILKGVEVDIPANGRPALPPAIGALFDLVIAAVRDPMGLSREDQTLRAIAALDPPCPTILSHPNAPHAHESRQTATYDVDMDRIVRAAADHDGCLELTADPHRIDLGESHCPSARAQGVRVSLSSEAREPDHLTRMEAAVLEARRGWLEASDVLNTMPLADLRERLARHAHEYRLSLSDKLS